MLTFLSELWSIVTNLGLWIVFAVEESWNALMSVVEAVFSTAVAVLPSLPTEVGPPGFLESINWVFPVGAVVSVATTMTVSYGVFLGIRWAFKKAGVL